MAEHCFLACLGLLSYLSYIAQIHLPKNGTAHSGLDLPTSISNVENALQTGPSQCDGGKSSNETLYIRYNQGLCQLDLIPPKKSHENKHCKRERKTDWQGSQDAHQQGPVRL